MILEVTTLFVKRGMAAQFEASIPEAVSIISSAQGHRSHRIVQCVDDPYRYLLMIQWEEKANSKEHFQQSGRLKEIRYLLHGFYARLPETIYYETNDLSALRNNSGVLEEVC